MLNRRAVASSIIAGMLLLSAGHLATRVARGRVRPVEYPATIPPRRDRNPVDGTDFWDRHVTSATATDENLKRYHVLFREIRKTIAVLALCLGLGLGATLGVMTTEAPIVAACGVGAAGGGSAVIWLAAVIRRRLFGRGPRATDPVT